MLNQEGPFSERKHIVMANHEKPTASTKLKNLIPNMPYKGETFHSGNSTLLLLIFKVRITAERLGRQSSEKVIEFRTLPKLKEPDALTVNYTTSDGIYASWHIPFAEHVDGAVLSVYEKKLIGHGPVATVHLMKNETEKYISGLKVRVLLSNDTNLSFSLRPSIESACMRFVVKQLQQRERSAVVQKLK